MESKPVPDLADAAVAVDSSVGHAERAAALPLAPNSPVLRLFRTLEEPVGATPDFRSKFRNRRYSPFQYVVQGWKRQRSASCQVGRTN
jgi:hypothetical protein